MSGLLVAQESVTSATVKWFIVALLVVAVLLGVLTVWYWKHTDPRQRMAASRRAPVNRVPAPRPLPLDHEPPASPDTWGGAAVPSAPSAHDAAADARRRAQAAADGPTIQSLTQSAAAADDLEADDWLRLTGPQALPRDGA